MNSKRLAMLEKMTAQGSKDPFAWYGLALEYSSLSRHDEALVTFQALRALDPGYVPMYLMCGDMLVKLGRAAEARIWFQEGLVAAKAKGDGHALSELHNALGAIGPG